MSSLLFPYVLTPGGTRGFIDQYGVTVAQSGYVYECWIIDKGTVPADNPGGQESWYVSTNHVDASRLAPPDGTGYVFTGNQTGD